MTRQQLDAALLVAEQEQINGLPQWPEMFPLSLADAEISSFKLRRLETMCSSHMLLAKDLNDRLHMLKVGCPGPMLLGEYAQENMGGLSLCLCLSVLLYCPACPDGMSMD